MCRDKILAGGGVSMAQANAKASRGLFWTPSTITATCRFVRRFVCRFVCGGVCSASEEGVYRILFKKQASDPPRSSSRILSHGGMQRATWIFAWGTTWWYVDEGIIERSACQLPIIVIISWLNNCPKWNLALGNVLSGLNTQGERECRSYKQLRVTSTTSTSNWQQNRLKTWIHASLG